MPLCKTIGGTGICRSVNRKPAAAEACRLVKSISHVKLWKCSGYPEMNGSQSASENEKAFKC